MISNDTKSLRQSAMEMGEIYFWTATINHWQHLLWGDVYKDIIIESLEYLTNKQKIDVFGFVIMPNHIHTIWRPMELNGNETPQSSFLKYTAHEFKKKLLKLDRDKLELFQVDSMKKSYEFWQRDPMAIPLFRKEVAFQKLDYTHYNPLAEHWQLSTDPCEYKYSSARYYECDEKSFPFLKDLREEF